MIVVAGAGFVGGRLAKILKDKGHPVIALTRQGGGETMAVDVTQPEELQALREKIGPVRAVAFAASSGRGGPDAYRRVFLQGGEHLLQILKPQRLVFTSSTSVYGQTRGEKVDETAVTEPTRESAQILLEAERMVRNAGGIAARLSGIYGPGRSIITKRYLEGAATIDGDPTSDEAAEGRLLNQIHAEDAASALEHLLFVEEGAGEIYNVSDGTPIRQRTIYADLDSRFGKGIPPTQAPDLSRKRAWSDKAVESSKLQASGWKPRYASYLEALEDDPELLSSILAQVGEA